MFKYIIMCIIPHTTSAVTFAEVEANDVNEAFSKAKIRQDFNGVHRVFRQDTTDESRWIELHKCKSVVWGIE